MSTIFERATKQYKEKIAGTISLSIEVPEWPDEQGQASLLYFKPVNTLRFREFSRFVELARQQTVESALDIIILRALDENQQAVFKPAQRAELFRSLDPQVILKIIRRMNEIEDNYSNEQDEAGLTAAEIAEKNF